MEKILVGKVVSTHGIKGEIRILSDFQFKDKVYGVGKKLIIDNQEYEIKSYRQHKCFDMVTLDDFKDINEVLFLMKKPVCVLKEWLSFLDNEVLDEELSTYQVVTEDGRTGVIKDIFFAGPKNKILRVQLDREVLVPFNSPMLIKIDKAKKQVIIKLMEGM